MHPPASGRLATMKLSTIGHSRPLHIRDMRSSPHPPMILYPSASLVTHLLTSDRTHPHIGQMVCTFDIIPQSIVTPTRSLLAEVSVPILNVYPPCGSQLRPLQVSPLTQPRETTKCTHNGYFVECVPKHILKAPQSEDWVNLCSSLL